VLRHPAFRKAFQEGAQFADSRVAAALYQRAIGMTVTTTTTKRRENRDAEGSLLGTTEIVAGGVRALGHGVDLLRGFVSPPIDVARGPDFLPPQAAAEAKAIGPAIEALAAKLATRPDIVATLAKLAIPPDADSAQAGPGSMREDHDSIHPGGEDAPPGENPPSFTDRARQQPKTAQEISGLLSTMLTAEDRAQKMFGRDAALSPSPPAPAPAQGSAAPSAARSVDHRPGYPSRSASRPLRRRSSVLPRMASWHVVNGWAPTSTAAVISKST
jgi:hypothetical protein